MDPSEPQDDRLAQILQREVVRRTRITAALVLATCAVTVATAGTWRERQRLNRAGAELTECERSCAGQQQSKNAPLFSAARILASPLATTAILSTPLEALCPTGEIRDITLDEAVTRGAVHLVNLWQISCPSCKREFPLLARALGRTDDVRFLPVDDSNIGHPAEDYRVAQARHDMPTPSLALIDRDRDGARLLPALQALAAASPELAPDGHLVYPLSFALDCDRQMRWWKVGPVNAVEADALAKLLAALRREPSCRADAPQPAICNGTKPPRPVRKTRPPSASPPLPDPAGPPAPVEEFPPPLLQPPEAPAIAPGEPEQTPAPKEPPEPSPRLYQSRSECRKHCPPSTHNTCQPAELGQFLCALPPAAH